MFKNVKTSALLKHRIKNRLLSNTNDNGDNNEKKRKIRKLGREYLKT